MTKDHMPGPDGLAPNLESLGARLKGKRGRTFWRSLEELSRTKEFTDFLAAEFPALATHQPKFARRTLLKAMGASLALAGLAGCDGKEDETALPYVNAPESVVPGKPKWYASAVTLNGYAQPILGKTYVGRPVKLEGNPDHPASTGTCDAFTQAALLGLYDPDRSQSPRYLDRPVSWSAFDDAIQAQIATLNGKQGEGFRLLTGTVTSPSLAGQIKMLVQRWPKARWHVFEPVSEDLRLEATRLVFGRPLDQQLGLDQAELVVSLDDDFLGAGPRQTMQAGLWAKRRRGLPQGEGGIRLFVAEPTPTITGAMAEERLAAPHGRIAALLLGIAAAFDIEAGSALDLTEGERSWVDRIGGLLKEKAGRALVTVGSHREPQLQALALLVNQRIGSFGRTLRFTEPIAVLPPDGAASFARLVGDMASGQISALLMIGVNPVYAGFADLNFAAHLEKVGLRIHAGLHDDETAQLSHWHLPMTHELESWSDARAVDGTATIIQPLVRRFYSVRSQHEILAGLLGGPRDGREIIQATWRQNWQTDFDAHWSDALYRGYVPGTAAAIVEPAIAGDMSGIPQANQSDQEPAGEVNLVLRPDPTIWDGRFSGNAWLQELPKPLTKITWGNVLTISPRLAAERQLKNGDEINLEVAGRTLTGAVWIVPGQEAKTIAVSFGHGRSACPLSAGLGCNAFALRDSDHPWYVPAVQISPTGQQQDIATTQLHQAMDGFDFVRLVDASALSDGDQAVKPRSSPNEERHTATFYPRHKWDDPSWGMTIDLDLCIGCNACVVACVAENNIPMVGKDLVAMGREMHWLRVDHYYEGPPDAPASYFQPVPCMHCEQAPCEMGCPVNAAVHSSDGLNLQVYNRCIGTRTCSSYCPYKVRRFNWFDYTGDDPETIKAMRNPDVTVRQRGVMEKCTYCVQRIGEARIAAEIDGRKLRDGDVVTACQQACPTRAIIFGNVMDPTTEVSRQKADVRNYTLLEEANTWPRTTYLARIETKPARDEGEG
ncbi:TAT-variant-translocated molybdopterin oxidoreductase [Dongia soli]|uniref:TAT-variant-translocated molybdopterin oxidoreductase n=1 Tax=Dongia soli TaxID=600628 RepID=A0ABU5EDH4_9PROT|nr:TAT-variant-translocated molybdopterin oxidoreductase [Dongia soli]MDY0884428.1 TAT-variant-translocated molybdopterin oxidoreductase [Dongia soli]